MGDDSEQVTALIRQLPTLERAESTPRLEFQPEQEIEERIAKRTRIRQELVQVLHLRDRKKS